MPFVTLLAALFVARVYLCLSQRTVQSLGVVAVAGIAVIFALPMLQTAHTHNQRILQSDSRETARVWIDQNLPAGSRIFIEPYSPYVDPQRYTVEGDGLTEHPLEWYAQNGFEYIVFSYGAYGRFYETRERYAETVQLYDQAVARFPEIKRFNDGGYEIRVHQTGVENLPAQRIGVRFGIFGEWLELIGYDVKLAQAGKPLTVDMVWRVLAERRESLTLTARLLDRDDKEIAHTTVALAVQGITRTPVALASAEPGMYRLQLEIDAQGQGRVPALSRQRQPVSDKLRIDAIKIAPAPIPAGELQRAHPANVKFASAITLLSYTLQKQNDVASVTLYWKSDAKISSDHTVFLHLVDTDGNLRAQIDAQPRGGTYPTSLWDVGEIVRDDFSFSLTNLPAGEYRVLVGMYEQPSLARLNVFNAAGNILGDHFALSETFPISR